jgi:hypothetical protein
MCASKSVDVSQNDWVIDILEDAGGGALRVLMWLENTNGGACLSIVSRKPSLSDR